MGEAGWGKTEFCPQHHISQPALHLDGNQSQGLYSVDSKNHVPLPVLSHQKPLLAHDPPCCSPILSWQDADSQVDVGSHIVKMTQPLVASVPENERAEPPPIKLTEAYIGLLHERKINTC